MAAQNPLAMLLSGGQGGGGNPLPGVALGALSGANAGGSPEQMGAGLQGADPQMLMKQLDQVNKLLGVIFVQTFTRLPNVAGQVSKTMNQLQRAIKEATQAANVSSVIKKRPIQMSAVGGAPDQQSDAGGM